MPLKIWYLRRQDEAKLGNHYDVEYVNCLGMSLKTGILKNGPMGLLPFLEKWQRWASHAFKDDLEKMTSILEWNDSPPEWTVKDNGCK